MSTLTPLKCYQHHTDKHWCCSSDVVDMVHVVSGHAFCAKCCPVHKSLTTAKVLDLMKALKTSLAHSPKPIKKPITHSPEPISKRKRGRPRKVTI